MASGVVSGGYPLEVLRPPDGVDFLATKASSWPHAQSHRYLDNLKGRRDVVLLRRQLSRLPDGAVLVCRGRDNLDVEETAEEWDYGFCQKRGADLFFAYASGDAECFSIGGVNFVHLVHLALRSPAVIQENAPAMTRQQPVLVLAHGWSPQVGPRYPLIQRMEAHALRKGWKVIVPDFRPAYAHGEPRARAERVKMLCEELIVLLGRDGCHHGSAPSLALVGHSQGGAAVASCCTDKVCRALDIRGVLMLGPEDPTFHDRMNWKPPVRHVEIVHAVDDDTISIQSIRRLAKHWHCPMVELFSPATPKGAVTASGDDVHHDFLANDLMKRALQVFDQFLEKCVQE